MTGELKALLFRWKAELKMVHYSLDLIGYSVAIPEGVKEELRKINDTVFQIREDLSTILDQEEE